MVMGVGVGLITALSWGVNGMLTAGSTAGQPGQPRQDERGEFLLGTGEQRSGPPRAITFGPCTVTFAAPGPSAVTAPGAIPSFRAGAAVCPRRRDAEPLIPPVLVSVRQDAPFHGACCRPPGDMPFQHGHQVRRGGRHPWQPAYLELGGLCHRGGISRDHPHHQRAGGASPLLGQAGLIARLRWRHAAGAPGRVPGHRRCRPPAQQHHEHRARRPRCHGALTSGRTQTDDREVCTRPLAERAAWLE